MIATPIVHHPFEFAIGPLNLTGFGIAMMAAFGIAHFVSQEVLEAARRRCRDHERRDVRRARSARSSAARSTSRSTRPSPDVLPRAVRPRGVRVLGRLHRRRAAVVARDPLAQAELPARRRRRGGRDRGGLRDRPHRMLGGRRRLRPRCGTGRSPSRFPKGAPASNVANMNAEFHANLPATMSPDTVVSVYPTQLLEVVLGIVMFWILWRLRKPRARRGLAVRHVLRARRRRAVHRRVLPREGRHRRTAHVGAMGRAGDRRVRCAPAHHAPRRDDARRRTLNAALPRSR